MTLREGTILPDGHFIQESLDAVRAPVQLLDRLPASAALRKCSSAVQGLQREHGPVDAELRIRKQLLLEVTVFLLLRYDVIHVEDDHPPVIGIRLVVKIGRHLICGKDQFGVAEELGRVLSLLLVQEHVLAHRLLQHVHVQHGGGWNVRAGIEQHSEQLSRVEAFVQVLDRDAGAVLRPHQVLHQRDEHGLAGPARPPDHDELLKAGVRGHGVAKKLPEGFLIDLVRKGYVQEMAHRVSASRRWNFLRIKFIRDLVDGQVLRVMRDHLPGTEVKVTVREVHPVPGLQVDTGQGLLQGRLVNQKVIDPPDGRRFLKLPVDQLADQRSRPAAGRVLPVNA